MIEIKPLDEKIWNETMMILSDEDYVLDDLEDLKNAIMVFIGRTIIEKDKQIQNLQEELKEKIKIWGKYHGIHGQKTYILNKDIDKLFLKHLGKVGGFEK